MPGQPAGHAQGAGGDGAGHHRRGDDHDLRVRDVLADRGVRGVAEFGIGLAAAVALDAFILRTVLVPAAMHLFGNANWWLPRWLDRRLPHLAIEPPETALEPTWEPAWEPVATR
jgi:hypothetical protein